MNTSQEAVLKENTNEDPGQEVVQQIEVANLKVNHTKDMKIFLKGMNPKDDPKEVVPKEDTNPKNDLKKENPQKEPNQ